MSLFITSLNSGSNGNCYYIGNDTEAVLIDAGISCKETEKRMRLLGLSMKNVKAIFISHEHIDHIKGLPILAEKYDLPVYITGITLKYSRISINGQLTKTFTANEPIQIGNLYITAFAKNHDAGDPHSFIITSNGITVGVFTDIGCACTNVTSHFKKCHAAFLEANYDEVLLEQGHYPLYLKNRIRGGKGHLSNKQALEIFIKHRPPFMTHLLLAHLSKENNNAVTAKKLFEQHALNTEIIVASRYEQTPVYTIFQKGQPLQKVSKRKEAFKLMQLSLFE
jgi:phosphoribosyl 1,2-cyclic phosphodiesterase